MAAGELIDPAFGGVPGAIAGGRAGAMGGAQIGSNIGSVVGSWIEDQILLMSREEAFEDAAAEVTGSGDRNCPRLESNPKHHKNSKSPEPDNVKELYRRSIEDEDGRRWAKDENGIIHRFSAPSNGRTHWNGSTGGSKPIKPGNIPPEIGRRLK
jgi:hypothetical protein